MKKLNEFYGFQALGSLPQDVNISKEDKVKLSKLKWNDIKMLDPDGEVVGNSNIFSMNFDLGKMNHVLPGIVMTIEQDSRTELNQPHIQIHKDLQGIGLASKLYRLVLQEFGHLISKKSKRLSDKEISGLYKKLAKDSKIDLFEQNGNKLLLHKDNPMYKETKEVFIQVS
tara:strand:+ start:310 stop:819 length:510 start_codon:yes stop_codon:yes gene_type:complete